MAGTRAAVVIGVNSTGELAPLESAVAAAEDVTAWLRREGFRVAKLTDARRPVTAAAVKKAVTQFVDAGTYEQLVLYFSGHGYWKNNAELWLLSAAPEDADEAVSWVETIEFARDSGIPHVVVISDACRSIPTSKTGMGVRGSVVFPNRPTNPRVQPKIDKLQASVVGTPAYEISLPEDPTQKISVFTHCLRRAFSNPDADMVLEIVAENRKIEVIPVRRLEKFLRREVPALLSSVSIVHEQVPVIDVLSDDNAYIGRVRRLAGTEPAGPAPGAVPITLDEVARAAVAAEISPKLKRSRRGPEAAAARQFRALREPFQAPAPVRRYESETGFTVSGADVLDKVAGEGGHLDGAEDEHPNTAAVRVWLDGDRYHCNVAITLGDGSGTVLPALRGYIGHITVVGGGVSNVNYVPSEYSWRWGAYERRREEIDRLRSAVAAAAGLGALRLREDEAAEFAHRVRVQKQFDPTLGMYAAYAYAEAGLYEQVASVRRYMQADVRVSLYDVALLDRTDHLDHVERSRVAPFCPMLSLGWNYLRPRGVTLAAVVENAQDDLVQSVWTTFRSDSMSAISDALREGALR